MTPGRHPARRSSPAGRSRRFLITFWPVCSGWTRTDLDPPFVDGSIRREPDLQIRHPSISALCRGPRFAPRLHEGDEVVYITCKGRYLDDADRGWRLVAHLKVNKRFESHEDAARWYLASGSSRLPSNCMVRGNPPLPLERTHGGSGQGVKRWDRGYRIRARKYPVFLACRCLWINLVDPPQVRNTDLRAIFGGIPGTQSGKEITVTQCKKLMRLAKRRRRRTSGGTTGDGLPKASMRSVRCGGPRGCR